MNVIFIHQNFPAQYVHLARYLVSMNEHTVVAIGEDANVKARGFLPGVRTIGYPKPAKGNPKGSYFIKDLESEIFRGLEVTKVLEKLKEEGFIPDIICVHPAWGEGLFLREVYPDVPILMHAEYFFRHKTNDRGFDPEFCAPDADKYYFKIRRTTQYLSLGSADLGLSASEWQASTYPKFLRKKIRVIHEGVNTDQMTPNPKGNVTLAKTPIEGDYVVTKVNGQWMPAGRELEAEKKKYPVFNLDKNDKIVVYMSRNLEPYRGYHIFMRALPTLQKKLPDTKFVIIGGTANGYTPNVPPQTFKRLYLDEVRDSLDMSRIFYTGQVTYGALKVLYNISRVHLHMTYPFVLSWSVLEAMSCEALILGSNVPSVREVIEHNKNGLTYDFFDQDQLVETIVDTVNNPEKYIHLRKAARQTVVEHFCIKKTVPAQYALLQELVRRTPEQLELNSEYE